MILNPLQPPSRNRRERAELRPDFFDSAAMIEDESVRMNRQGFYLLYKYRITLTCIIFADWNPILVSYSFWGAESGPSQKNSVGFDVTSHFLLKYVLFVAFLPSID